MEQPPSATEATLCHPIVDGDLLLIRKRRGLGAGKLVGPGGKLEPGETPRDCVIREVQEEIGGRVQPWKVGEMDFRLGGDPEMFVHVFRADSIEGHPVTTEEAIPEFHPVTDPPYDEMWPSDREWLPKVIDDEPFAIRVNMDDAAESVTNLQWESP